MTISGHKILRACKAQSSQNRIFILNFLPSSLRALFSVRLLESIDKQLSLALKAEQFKLTRYQNGDSTFLEVLTAQNSRLDLEQQKLISKGNLLAARIQLYRALAGDLNIEKLVRHGSMASTEQDKALLTH
ncbi:TolC family protein [Endozoicomonas sp. ALC020]|uniref:TolC family protein n=1 Tax=unclassified Endozoicomonas TaxID=2644528 RepID=UPI003BB0C183